MITLGRRAANTLLGQQEKGHASKNSEEREEGCASSTKEKHIHKKEDERASSTKEKHIRQKGEGRASNITETRRRDLDRPAVCR